MKQELKNELIERSKAAKVEDSALGVSAVYRYGVVIRFKPRAAQGAHGDTRITSTIYVHEAREEVSRAKNIEGAIIYDHLRNEVFEITEPPSRDWLQDRIDALPDKNMNLTGHHLRRGDLYRDVLQAIADDTLVDMTPGEAAHRALYGDAEEGK